MPGFYQPGEYDVSGTIVGVVEKSRMLNGQKTVKPNDAVIGIASSGLHTNGYSLARKIFFETLGLKPKSYVAELKNKIGDELLKVHVTYGPLVQSLLKRFNSKSQTSNSKLPIKAFAHITGGGFVDNIPRVLPKNCDVLIRKGSWDMLPVFRMIESKGGVPDAELYQVFNMGIGMVVIVSAEKADTVLKAIRTAKRAAWHIGVVVKGRGEAKVV
jgi:phosphoribosylformylglycinamidine cyclo-ligase